MKISTLTMRNFRCFEALTVTMHPRLTVIAGLDNGDGKTTILEAVALAATALFGEGGLEVEPGLCANWRHDLRVEPNQFGTLNGFNMAAPAASASVSVESDWDVWRCAWPAASSASIAKDKVTAALTSKDALPLVVYYSTDRGTVDWPQRNRSLVDEANLGAQYAERLIAFEDSLAARSSFRPTFGWFLDREALELREARDQVLRGGKSYTDPVLDGVRIACERALPQCTGLRGMSSPPKIEPLVKTPTSEHRPDTPPHEPNIWVRATSTDTRCGASRSDAP